MLRSQQTFKNVCLALGIDFGSKPYLSVREACSGSWLLRPPVLLARFTSSAKAGHASAAAYWLSRYLESTPLPTLNISYRNYSIPLPTLESIVAENRAARRKIEEAERNAQNLREFYGMQQGRNWL